MRKSTVVPRRGVQIKKIAKTSVWEGSRGSVARRSLSRCLQSPRSHRCSRSPSNTHQNARLASCSTSDLDRRLFLHAVGCLDINGTLLDQIKEGSEPSPSRMWASVWTTFGSDQATWGCLCFCSTLPLSWPPSCHLSQPRNVPFFRLNLSSFWSPPPFPKKHCH